MTRRAGFLLLLALLSAGVWAQPARAEYNACNETSYILEMAVATRSELGDISQGWFVITPGACQEILRAPLEQLELFAYARATEVYGMDGIYFPGNIPFCIAPEDFLIQEVGLCRMRDLQHARFAPIVFAGEDWTTYFSEAQRYDQERARIAGWQRLLARLGYAVGAIDGILGGRTRDALAAFRKEQGLGAEDDILFDAMSQALLSRRGESGLEICNRSRHRVWAAVGIGAGDSAGDQAEDAAAEDRLAAVETRGWLPAEPGDCVAILEEPLQARDYYLFAEAVDANGFVIDSDTETTVWGGEHVLCVSAIRFAIRTQGACDARNLDQRGFYRVETGDAAHITEILR